MKHFRTSLLYSFLLCAACLRAEDFSPEPTSLPAVVVTTQHSREPLVAVADPKAPAQPAPAHDGADVLKSIPGFSVIRKGGTDGDPVLRGLAGSRLSVLLDGESIFGGCGNRMDPPTAYVFPTAYDRITVIKGPQTVLHGPGNSAGVVLFERDHARLSAHAASLDTSLTTASFGRFDAFADAQAGTPVVQVRATGTYTRADDYQDGDGRAVNSSYARWSANATTVWTPAAHTSVTLSAARSDGEAAYADRAMDGTVFDRENISLRVRQEQISPRITAAEVQIFHNYVDHVMDNFTLRTFTPTMMMPGRAVSNPDRLTTGGRGLLELLPTDDLQLQAGVDWQRNTHTVRSTANELTAPYAAKPRMRDARFKHLGLFAEARQALAAGQRLIAGARLDQWEVHDPRTMVNLGMMMSLPNPTAGHTRSSDLFSGFARFEQDLVDTPLTLYAGLGQVQRFPDYWEAIKNESAASASALGTAPETTRQIDLGALWRQGPLEFSVSLFAARIDDFILVQSGVVKSAGMGRTRSAIITRNIDATTLGGEASLGWRPVKHWLLDASLAYVRGDNDTDDRPLAQLPPLEGRLSLAYARDTWSVGGLLRAVAAQDRFAVNQGNIVGQDLGRSPGFAVVSLNASWQVRPQVRVSAGVDNLLDRTYAEHISRAGAMIAGFTQTTRVNEPGRTLWLRLDCKF
ncbi:MAG: TonB-dependent copper receptor [Opitutaceae bacterium]|nr:TonB-dependent copper receptor [Opitutaceae bacterium]